MTRRKIIAGNWKMNLGRQESIDLALGVSELASSAPSVELLVFPATVWVAQVSDAVRDSKLAVGGQNCHDQTKGAFTGEVSATMLREVCSYVMAGHSERRHVFDESDDLIAAKVRATLDAGMQVVLCVGETLAEREAGTAESVVESQLRTGLGPVTADEVKRVVIAYEPVWAIGTGVSASPQDAQAMCSFVRGRVSEMFSSGGADVPVLYGGSVTGDNAQDLLGQADIDGGLVGGASLDVQSFRAIVLVSQSV